ncbi:MAG: zinc-ribbon domain-containing protein [Lachnospiraceae bacterium]|nr:zinc-ribbon domain-containing protein [Lachnospiraceae bacterium]
MFCSKCGTQLPDGAMFCTSCGNQLNSQPAAPMMPVEPMAPVMDTPVMDAPVMDAPVMDAPVMDAPIMGAPVMMETPVMDAPMMDTPIMPVAEPVMDAPAFDPAGQYPYNNVPNNMPYDMQNNMANNMPVNNGPKKSKAPLFIGLGIAALVAIIVGIVLALVLSKDDDKKKNNSSKKPTSVVEETTEEETTEEETVVNVDVNEEDAENTVTNFLKALNSSNYSKASKYIWPVLLDIYAEEGASKDEACELMAEGFQDMDGNMLDYEISSSWIEDSSYFEHTIDDLDYDGYDVYDYSSYKEPTSYAVVAMDFIYEGEYAWVSFDLAYIDDKFYIFDYDIDEIEELKSELESESTEVSEFDFETSLEENYEFFSQSVDGTLTQFDGYTLTIPSDWTASSNGYSAPDQKNFILVSANPLGQSKDETLKALCETYIELGYENLEFGNLSANDKIGYYISSKYIGVDVFIMIFFNEAEDTMYTAIATSEVPDSEYYDIAKAIAASIEIQ